MQETRNNNFGSKKCSTTLRQAKTGKHECRNVTATSLLHFGTRAYDPKQLLRVSCILWCYFQSDFQLYFKTPVCGDPFSIERKLIHKMNLRHTER